MRMKDLRFIEVLLFGMCLFGATTVQATLSIDTEVIKRSVVFIFGADANGEIDKTKAATGFLVSVPERNSGLAYPLLITARHVVDPAWAGCTQKPSTRVYIRVNKVNFDATKNESGVDYLPLDLMKNGRAVWMHSKDDFVDAAVLPVPEELDENKYVVKFILVRNFGNPEEIARIGIGSDIASAGLVPGLEGVRRNYPVFKFGKVGSVPDEMTLVKCDKDSLSKPLRVWWLAANLVPGNSGSPIFFTPLFPPGAAIVSGEPRAMILGLQSVVVEGSDLAGMTPAAYILDVIRAAVPTDADLSLGPPEKR